MNVTLTCVFELRQFWCLYDTGNFYPLKLLQEWLFLVTCIGSKVIASSKTNTPCTSRHRQSGMVIYGNGYCVSKQIWENNTALAPDLITLDARHILSRPIPGSQERYAVRWFQYKKTTCRDSYNFCWWGSVPSIVRFFMPVFNTGRYLMTSFHK